MLCGASCSGNCGKDLKLVLRGYCASPYTTSHSASLQLVNPYLALHWKHNWTTAPPGVGAKDFSAKTVARPAHQQQESWRKSNPERRIYPGGIALGAVPLVANVAPPLPLAQVLTPSLHEGLAPGLVALAAEALGELHAVFKPSTALLRYAVGVAEYTVQGLPRL